MEETKNLADTTIHTGENGFKLPELNRKGRRMRNNNRNLSPQNIPIFNSKGEQIDTKKVFHLKPSNLPRIK